MWKIFRVGKKYKIQFDKKNIAESLNSARKMESKSDQMQEEISTYLAEGTKYELSLESSKGAAAMTRLTNELESIGDSSLNLFLQLENLENDPSVFDAFFGHFKKRFFQIWASILEVFWRP